MSIMIISTPEFKREWKKLCENVIDSCKTIGKYITKYVNQ